MARKNDYLLNRIANQNNQQNNQPYPNPTAPQPNGNYNQQSNRQNNQPYPNPTAPQPNGNYNQQSNPLQQSQMSQQPPIPQQGGQISLQPNSKVSAISEDEYFKKKEKVKEKLKEITSSNKKHDNINFIKSTIENLLQKEGLDSVTHSKLLREIINEITGLGILQPLLDDENIDEIVCMKYDNIWVEKNGKMIPTDIRFHSEKELRLIIDKILQPLGRRVDDSSPLVNARLPDKSRVNIVIPPIALEGATLDIRKFSKEVFTEEKYLGYNTLTKEMIDFLKFCVIGRKNIFISGGTGSGKTTFLNFCSRYIPDNELIVTIEDTAELQLLQRSLRALESRTANAEGTGEVTIRDCVKNSLRMRPDRIVVGECRGAEIVDMLQAMNTGHDGSLSTGHANSPKDLIERLTNMFLMAGLDIPEKAIKKQIADAIDVIIQVKRLGDGTRKVIQISEVIGYGIDGAEENNNYVEQKGLDKKFLIKKPSNGVVYLQDIFKYDDINNEFKTTGWVPTFLENFIAKEYPLSEELFLNQ
ncbi:MAG: CpaF family protein [Candidatus Woesearchaeota archaeon]